MNFTITLPASGIKKAYLLGLLLAFISFRSYSQSCDCPAVDDCGPCEGGMTSLSVEYTGGTLLGAIEAWDGDGNLLESNGGTSVTFYSNGYPNVPFAGDQVTIIAKTILLLTASTTIINTSCSEPIFQGSSYQNGDFTILGGESVGGGTLCCSDSDMPINPPVISGCPADIVVAADASCQAVVSWTPPTANNNNCGDTSPAEITGDYSSGATFNLGTTVVTYTATDDYGNTATCSFNVIINDESPPLISGCPGEDIVVTSDGSCEAIVNWTPLTASDNCGIFSFKSTHNPGGVFPIGTTEVVYTAEDNNGITSTCSFNVIVNDEAKPVITECPTDIFITLGDSECSTQVSWIEPAASDNCRIASFTSTYAPNDIFYVGTTPVIYTATDDYGNTNTCEFNVIVTDETPPIIVNCPPDIHVTLSASECSRTVTWSAPTPSDNCGMASFTRTHSSGGVFSVGTTPVEYTATDVNGNTSTCSFNVIVTDEIAPVIENQPADVYVALGASECSTAAYWIEPTASDNCEVFSFTSTHEPGEIFSLGTTPVTYTAIDDYTNSATFIFNVIVEDTTNPTISCPADKSISVDATCDAVLPDYTAEATAADNCSVTVTQDPPINSPLVIGTTTVTLTATDPAGNQATCTFDVIVEDTTNPTINCPADKTISVDASCDAVLPDYTAEAIAADNCSVVVTQDPPVNSALFVGTTAVTLTATDPSGNKATCTFNVIVKDVTKPTITCPADKTISVDAACDAVLPDYTAEATAADNCSVAVTQDPPIDTPLPIGTTTVTLTATDPTGNKATCTFDVIVEDTTKPTISCPADKAISVDATCDAVLPDYTAEATAADNCSVTVTQDPPINSPLVIRTTTVTLTATDPAGNQATCTFDVIVEDTTNPTINCPADKTISVDASCDAVLPDYTAEAIAADNCSVVVTQDPPVNSALFVGTTAVTLTATDPSGNKATCTFNVIVKDVTKPTITCLADKTISVDAACDAVLPDYTAEATAADNCSVAVTQDPPIDTPLPIGTTTVTLTATDPTGNKATCTFDVIVEDTTKPTITCPADKTISVDATCDAILPDYTTEAVAADNCSVTVTQDPPINSALPIGTTTVTLTATDPAGNQASCTFDVIVEDTTAPKITCPADQTISVDASCEITLPDYRDIATATDNCSSVTTIIQSPVMGTSLDAGITTVTLTASDAVGNEEICTFNVNVLDETAPVISGCPNDIYISLSASECSWIGSWQDPTVTGNCQPMTSNYKPGHNFPIGTTTVVYTASDAYGKTSTCSFDVTVEDKIKPQIFGCSPATVIEVTADSSCEAIVSWEPFSASDNCNFTLTSNYRPGDAFPVGNTDVVYTATDDSGNKTTCSFKVKVKDKTAPVVSGCITSPITTTAVSSSCYATVNWSAPTAVDNCETTVTSSHNPGDNFPIGTTIVTYTFSDNSDNVSTCSFDVIVEGVIQNDGPPVITGCPNDITAEADASGQVTVDWFTPTATASCGEAMLTSSHEPGDLFPVGTTNVQYTFEDFAGRTSSCSFDVIVSYEELEFEIAKVLTPDGNGINDEWVLSNIERFSDNKVVIVDRWGSVVFSASGYNNENVVWKGMNRNGALVPTGTYFYTISVRFVTEVVEKVGFIEVIR